MEKWAIDNNENWLEFFYKISTGDALNWIRTGHISPWIVLNSSTIEHLYNRMSDEQILLVDKYIEYSWWKVHIARNRRDNDYIKALLEEYKL